MEPLFKDGDKVRIKKRIYDSISYRSGFVDGMAKLAGNIYTINSHYISSSHPTSIIDDGYVYCLTEDCGRGWLWNSSMLEKVENGNHSEETQPKENNDSVLRIKLKRKNNIKLNFNN